MVSGKAKNKTAQRKILGLFPRMLSRSPALIMMINRRYPPKVLGSPSPSKGALTLLNPEKCIYQAYKLMIKATMIIKYTKILVCLKSFKLFVTKK